jgi:WD40 repeat protein
MAASTAHGSSGSDGNDGLDAPMLSNTEWRNLDAVMGAVNMVVNDVQPAGAIASEWRGSISVATIAGCSEKRGVSGEHDDGAAADATFGFPTGLSLDLDGNIVVCDWGNDLIRIISANFSRVKTLAGSREDTHINHRDGAAMQARFYSPFASTILRSGSVLVSDEHNSCLRLISRRRGGKGDWRVSTVVGEADIVGYTDGDVSDATIHRPMGLLTLQDGRVMFCDSWNHCIRLLSADLQTVTTVAGGNEAMPAFMVDKLAMGSSTGGGGFKDSSAQRRVVSKGYKDGNAKEARFKNPVDITMLPDGQFLITDTLNNRIRALNADLQTVRTVAGDGSRAYRDGAALNAGIAEPHGIAALPDGRVLFSSEGPNIRMLSADLQEVTTLAGDGDYWHNDGVAKEAGFLRPRGILPLPDGRVLIAGGNDNCIRVLTGFPAALLGTKPSYKPPKRTNQQQKKKKRALGGASSNSSGGGACSSSRLVPKRSRSGASSSGAAAPLYSSDSEDEEQPGGSAAEAEAEAEPLV